MADEGHVKLLAVEWASSGLPGDSWTLNTPPDRCIRTEWLRGDPSTHRMVVVVERNGAAAAHSTLSRWYETAVLRVRKVG